MHRLVFLLLLVGALAADSLPAIGQTYFSRRYANLNPGFQLGFTSVIETDSGYVALGNAINYPSTGSRALALYFLNADGLVRRTRHYVLPEVNPGFAGSLHQVADGGYVFAAQTISSVFPFPGSTLLLRVSAAGDTLWTRRWQRTRGEDALSMCVLPDGGFAVVGLLTDNVSGSEADFVLTRTDANGNIRWWQTYDNLLQDFGYNIVPTPDGGFLLGGFSYDLQQHDAFVVKTDSLGGEQWRRTFGSTAFDDLGSVVTALHDGNYAVGVATGTGGQPGMPSAQFRSTIYKLDAQGQTLWQRRYGPSREVSEMHALHELPDGSLVAAGQQADDTAPRMPGGTVFKICPDGDSLWFRTYKILTGPNSHNYLSDLQPTNDGGFVAAGYLFSRPPDTGSSDGWVFRLDLAGHLLAGGPSVARRCQLVGVDAPGPTGTGVEVWPNPAPNGRFSLSLLPARGPASLTLTDARGRTVWQGQASGTAQLNLSRYAPGLYLLRVRWADGSGSSRKLVRP